MAGLKNFFKIFSFLFFLLSCTNEELTINQPKVYYVLDEDLSISFMVVYPYNDRASLSASLTLSSDDGLYTWTSDCHNYALKGETYLVAGPFYPPEKTDDVMIINAILNYRDTKSESQISVRIPNSVMETPLSLLKISRRYDDNCVFRYDGNKSSHDFLTIAIIDNGVVDKKVELKTKTAHINAISNDSKALAVFHNSYSDLIFTKEFDLN